MKQIFIAFFLLLSLSAFAKNINLNPRIQTDGTALIENTKRKVQDRIHVQNTTNEAFEIVIIGIEKDGDEEMLCDTLLNAKEERYIPTTEDDDLDDFVQFRIELKNGAIEFCTAQCEWSDLHLVISKVRLTKPAGLCYFWYAGKRNSLKLI